MRKMGPRANQSGTLTAGGEADAKLVHEAVACAELLLSILREETETLRRFDGQQLLELLPQQEIAAHELADCMRAMGERMEQSFRIDPEYPRLEAVLREAHRLNQVNRVFIEGSLNHFKDFTDCLLPATYGPAYGSGFEGLSRRQSSSMKGLAFRKEA